MVGKALIVDFLANCQGNVVKLADATEEQLADWLRDHGVEEMRNSLRYAVRLALHRWAEQENVRY
jgi:hypothetical protein